MPKEKKKSKKQRKKELEEKRRLEQELLRQQQIEERQRQEECERQRREECERQRVLRERQRREELLRLSKESEEDIEALEKRQIDLRKFRTEQFEQTQWKKHLKCDAMPDLSDECELNDFLTQWKAYNIYEHCLEFRNDSDTKSDNKFSVNHIKYFVKDIENGYKLLPILRDVIFECIQTRNEKKLNYAKQMFIEMGQIAQNKLDSLTHKCLSNDAFTAVSECGMREDSEVTKHAMRTNLKFGLWASSMSNAFKNSKISFDNNESPHTHFGIALELPKQIAMKAKMALACRITQFSNNFLIYCNESTEYECIGPVLNIELFKLPSPPRNVFLTQSNTWMVQNLSGNQSELKAMKYGYANTAEASNETVSVSFKVPKYVVISDENNINLGWFDFETKQWKTEHFKDISFDSETRLLSFVTCHLSPLCIVQPRGTYYEYCDWKLSPSGVERCKVSLLTQSSKYSKIEIEIIGSKCKLLNAHIINASLANNLFKPHTLVRLLRESGINLCYKNGGNVSPNLLNKNANIEAVTHEEIASIAALFEVSKSKWNKSQNESAIVFRLRKPLTPNEEADLALSRSECNDSNDRNECNETAQTEIDSWQTVMINHEKCTFIDCNEQSKECNLETPLRELSHKTLLRCLSSYCTEDNIRDLQNTSFRFKETIKRMLNLLNLFRV